jgi:hypothetical protein
MGYITYNDMDLDWYWNYLDWYWNYYPLYLKHYVVMVVAMA